MPASDQQLENHVPATIASGFAQLRTNLEISDLQASTVSTRQTSVRAAVEAEMTVLTSFVVGSYARNTMIRPLADADIDIFAVLSPDYYSKYRPAGLLDRLRAVLLKTYPRTPKVSRNGQAVTITFTDFRVDVVPAFYRQGGGFWIPDSPNDAWLSTDPTKHDEALTNANRANRNDLVPVVKMLKGWNRTIGNAFSGFYLELLAINVLAGVTISDYPSGIRYLLDKGRDKIRYKQHDPAGLGSQVNGLDEVSTVDEAVSRFTSAYNRATKAESLARDGRIALAFDEWRKIFGDYFPAYG